MCKKCCYEKSLDPETLEVDVGALKSILRQLDRPYIEVAMKAAIAQYSKEYGGLDVPPDNKVNLVARYFKNIQSLPQYSWMTWSDGEELERAACEENAENLVSASNPRFFDEQYDEDYTPSNNLRDLFGPGYTGPEYRAMESKYQFLSQSYPGLTNLHIEALATYVKYKVKEEFAIAEGNVEAAEKWSSLAMKQADKAKINPNQLTKNDLQGGLNSFSELLMKVEQSEDIIPILPQFRFQPKDALDFTIWCYVNYLRETEGKPSCSYEDIYQFYDAQKEEYIRQYGDPDGIFAGDPSAGNREKVRRHISLPRDAEGGVRQ